MDLITLALARKGGGGTGAPGKDGLSAYEIAVKNGFEGSEQDWLNSLQATAETPAMTQEDIAAIFKEVIGK